MFNDVEDLVKFIESRKRVSPKNDLSNMKYYLKSQDFFILGFLMIYENKFHRLLLKTLIMT